MQKNTRVIFTSIILLFIAGNTFAQIKKGDKAFQLGRYNEAATYYQADTKGKNPRKQEAYIKLGNAYKAMNEYNKAEKAYETAFNLPGDSLKDFPPEFHLNYAQILKSKNKYPEAAEQYKLYLSQKPGDESVKKALKFCNDLQNTSPSRPEYVVQNLSTINTPRSEFSPQYANGKLLFAAEREEFDLSDNASNNSEPFLNIFTSDVNGANGTKARKFAAELNSPYHDGPACLSSDGNTLYLTRTTKVKGKSATFTAKIYVFKRDGKSWAKPTEFPLNSNEYSVAHANLSQDGKTMFFTSDMPGGYGGKDIWACPLDSGEFGEAYNLGPEVNSNGDEMFPYLSKSGKLYFSSNGLPGYGGLDIFTAKTENSRWLLLRNEGLNLNSSTDDFGITQVDDSTGYFSSDRVGGKGKDDIYHYRYSNRSLIVAGTILMTEDIRDFAKQKKVKLLDANGNVIDSTFTDENGKFAFKSLEGDKKYMVIVEEDDPVLAAKARFYMTVNDSTVQKVTNKYGDSKFAFKNLPMDPNALPELYTEDELVFAGNLLYGDKPSTALKNTRLKLIGEFGDVLEETTTNEFGAFAFRNIPSDQNYQVFVEETDIDLPEGTKITLTNKTGKVIQTYFTGSDKFNFKILASDRTTLQEMDADDVNLVMDVYGTVFNQDKQPIPNLRLYVRDENGELIQKLVTTDYGRFNFKNLPVDKTYLFETEEHDPALEGITRIYIADNKGVIYRTLEIFNGKFSFKMIEADKTMMGEFVVEDPWLRVAELKNPKQYTTKVPETKKKKAPVVIAAKETHPDDEDEAELSVTIIQNIYYAYGDYNLDQAAQSIMNKAVDVLLENPKFIMEIKSHTDSQSSAGFNMWLSKKRAQTAVDYLVSKGISKSRLKASGYGETKLLNKCKDGVGCSDEEHQINRRTEFKITKPVKH
ncbi:MAG: OmpA family protein [Bacteroidia bacterium]|jgi:outer membrane protein OmpA-like peptidoglycan-associated protein/tetratricopeptide (TPR) repeat protein|nr:OmpA family protein [Bacteroidia bacterium]